MSQFGRLEKAVYILGRRGVRVIVCLEVSVVGGVRGLGGMVLVDVLHIGVLQLCGP